MLTEVTPKPNLEVIKMLTELLTEAVTGQLQGMAVALEYSDKVSGNAFTSSNKPMVMLAEIEVLSRDYMDCNISLRREPLEQQ